MSVFVGNPGGGTTSRTQDRSIGVDSSKIGRREALLSVVVLEVLRRSLQSTLTSFLFVYWSLVAAGFMLTSSSSHRLVSCGA